MVLGFKTTINGKPTGFVEKILAGTKIHTIRSGDRWKKGMIIHPATGVRTENYKQITDDVLMVMSTQHIWIDYFSKAIIIDEKLMKHEGEKHLFVQNDGFDNVDDFFEAFKAIHPGTFFEGQIIHWTDYQY